MYQTASLEVERPPVSAPLPKERRSWATKIALTTSWTIVALLAATAVARLAAHDRFRILVWANSFTLYLYLPAYAVLVYALLRRRRILALAAAAVVVAHLVWVLPDFSTATRLSAQARSAPRLRVFSANLLADNAQPAGILGEIAQASPDVLVLQELSPAWEAALRASPLWEQYPHHLLQASEGAFGAALLSRFPLHDAQVWRVDGTVMIRANVEFAGRSVRIYNVHPFPPSSQASVDRWSHQFDELVKAVDQETGPLLVIGDFNATQYAEGYQRLVAGRLRSAHQDRGRGYATTWPNGQMPLPPIRIDHALLSPELACLSIKEGIGAGSDHKPLVVDVGILADSNSKQ